MIRIETERLILRRMEDRDLQAFLEYEHHPEHCRFLSRGPYDEAQARRFIATMRQLEPGREGPYLHLSVEERSTGRMIGTVCLRVVSEVHRQGEVGWFLHPACQGQGLATEASRALLDYGFSSLGLHRISALCDARNVRSERMMRRLGMRREAVYRECAFFDGIWHDQYLGAILAREWAAGTTAAAPPALD